MIKYLLKFHNFFLRSDVPEAVSYYSTMKNRIHQSPMGMYTAVDSARSIMNQKFLVQEQLESEINFLHHLEVAKELSNDPRFLSTFN